MKTSAFQIVLYTVFGLAALIGLFVFAMYKGDPSGENFIGNVVIWGTLPSDGMEGALAAISQGNEAMKSVSYVQKNPSTLASELSTAIATGGAPDLVLASQEELYTIAKFIAPIPYSVLPENAFTSSFIGGSRIFAVPNGSGYYGVPFLVDPIAIYSNRAILSSSGVAKAPDTWEAMTGLVPKVAVLTPSRQITRGLIALGTYKNVHNARAILSALFLQANIPVSGYSASGSLGASLGTEGLGQSVLSFYTQFTDPSKVSYTWNASLRDSQQSFLAGDLALYLGYASEARYLRSANPNLEFDIAPIPQPGTANIKGTYGLTYAFMIPRGAVNSKGAYQAAVTLTGATAQSAAAYSTGLAPASLDALSVAPSDPVAAVAYAEALYAKGWISPAPADTDTVFSGMISDVISGRSSLETALGSAERTLSALLQQ